MDTRILAVFLAHRNARHGKAWPKRETVAAKAHCHVETVTKATAKLVKLGYLVRHQQGQGRGHTTVWTFPQADARDAARKAQAKQPPPTPKAKPCKARAEKKPSRPAGFSAAPPYGTEVFEKNLPQTPSGNPAPDDLEAPRGEFLAAHSQDPETLSANLTGSGLGVAQQEPSPAEALGGQEQAEPSQQGALEAHRDSKVSKPTQPHHLAFPEALPAILCVQLGSMLASTPEAVAQEILDEMAFNARCHNINNPGGYVRRLLNLHQQGEFEPEVAHFERARRERIQANQRAKQIAERRHLEALAQGQLPQAPPLTMNRSDDDEARAEQALAQAKLAAKGALLSPEQLEQARLAYLASKGPQSSAAPTTALPHQGEEDAAGVAFFAAIKASLKPH